MAQDLVGEEAVVGGTAQHRLERHRVDGDGSARRARHVDLHAGVGEQVVGHGHLAGEHAGGLADVEHRVVGAHHQRPTARQVDGRVRGRVVGVHAEALHELAEQPCWRRR